MNSPMMQNMLNNPETLQDLMMSNPQMQEVGQSSTCGCICLEILSLIITTNLALSFITS